MILQKEPQSNSFAFDCGSFLGAVFLQPLNYICVIVTKKIFGNDYMKIRFRKIGSILGVALRLSYRSQKDFGGAKDKN